MVDPVEVRVRIERLIARVERRDDYGRLLADGEVIRDVGAIGDAEEWRAGLRRQARADRIKLRTGVKGCRVWAAIDRPPSDLELDEVRHRSSAIEGAHGVAAALGHRSEVSLIDGPECLLRCAVCGVHGYLEAGPDEWLGGELFESHCGGPSGS